MSQLTTLIKRVKTCQRKIKRQKATIKDLEGKLMNLVEYITFYRDYTEEEKKKAEQLLQNNNFIDNLEEDTVEQKLLEVESDPTYRSTCIRCGRKLSKPRSKSQGMGPICKQKHDMGPTHLPNQMI